QQLVLAGKSDGLLDIGGARTARNQRRLLVERSVPDATRPVVVLAARQQHLAAQAASQSLDGGTGQHRLAASKAPGRHVADSLQCGSEPSKRPARSKGQTRADESTSLHDRSLPFLHWHHNRLKQLNAHPAMFTRFSSKPAVHLRQPSPATVD